MPKDPARNQPNYKIGGGQLNEFEFAQNQGAMTAAEHERFQQQQAAGGDANAPQTEAERIQQLMADVHEKVARRKQKQQAGGATKQPAAGRKRGATKKAGAKSARVTDAQPKAASTKRGAKKATKKAAKKTDVKKSAPGVGKKSGAKSAPKRAGSKGATRTAGRGASKKSAVGKTGARKSAR